MPKLYCTQIFSNGDRKRLENIFDSVVQTLCVRQEKVLTKSGNFTEN